MSRAVIEGGAVGIKESSHDSQNCSLCATQGAILPTPIFSILAQKSHDFSESLYSAIVVLLASSNNHEKNFNTNGTKNGRNQVAFSNKKKQYIYIYIFGAVGKGGST